MENYSIKAHIGEGAHGLVLKATRLDGKSVALKKVLLKRINDGITNSVIREIKSLEEIDSKYVMKLLDVFPYGVGFVFVFDFMPSGLLEMIHDVENPLTEDQIKSYMYMLLRGVEYLHDHSIMHRDLKPANLLISSDGVLKIADLGLSRIIWNEIDTDDIRQYSHQVATRWYRAPELLYGARQYDNSIDLWAVGCILAELYNRSPLFPGETDIDQLAIVVRCLGTPNEEIWPGLESLPDYNKISFPIEKPVPWSVLLPDVPTTAVDLVSSFLVYNSKNRISAKEALKHAYFFTLPLACPLDKMPHPPDDHRKKIKAKQISVNKPLKDLLNRLNAYT